MTRDPELIRAILFAVEQQAPMMSAALSIAGVQPTLIQYHCKLMSDAGYLDGRDESNLSRYRFQILGLSWKGHELLDAIRADADWAAIREGLHLGDRVVPFSIIEECARLRARAAVGLPAMATAEDALSTGETDALKH